MRPNGASHVNAWSGRSVGPLKPHEGAFTRYGQPHSVSCCNNLKASDRNFHHDQHDYNAFKTQRAPCVDDVRQCVSRSGYGRQLALKHLKTLLQFVFVLQTRIEPLEFRLLPECVGLFGNGDAARDVLLDQERIADQLENALAARGVRPRSASSRAKGTITSNTAATRRLSRSSAVLLASYRRSAADRR